MGCGGCLAVFVVDSAERGVHSEEAHDDVLEVLPALLVRVVVNVHFDLGRQILIRNLPPPIPNCPHRDSLARAHAPNIYRFNVTVNDVLHEALSLFHLAQSLVVASEDHVGVTCGLLPLLDVLLLLYDRRAQVRRFQADQLIKLLPSLDLPSLGVAAHRRLFEAGGAKSAP